MTEMTSGIEEGLAAHVAQAREQSGTWIPTDIVYTGPNHYQHASMRARAAMSRISLQLEVRAVDKGNRSVIETRWLAAPRRRNGSDR